MKNKLQAASEFDLELENDITVHFKQQEKSESPRCGNRSVFGGGLSVTLLSSSAESGSALWRSWPGRRSP